MRGKEIKQNIQLMIIRNQLALLLSQGCILLFLSPKKWRLPRTLPVLQDSTSPSNWDWKYPVSSVCRTFTLGRHKVATGMSGQVGSRLSLLCWSPTPYNNPCKINNLLHVRVRGSWRGGGTTLLAWLAGWLRKHSRVLTSSQLTASKKNFVSLKQSSGIISGGKL